MKRITSVLCCIAFAISGIMMAVTASDPSPGTGYKTMAAATIPYVTPLPGTNAVLPQGLSLDLAKNESPNNIEQTSVVVDSFAIDSLKQRIIELEKNKRQVTKVKWRQAPAPDPIVKCDTIYQTRYYLATQTGSKEDDSGICIPIYEIRQVDKICPEIVISANKENNYYIDTGD